MNKGGIEANEMNPNLFGLDLNWDSGKIVATKSNGMKEKSKNVPTENGKRGLEGWQDGVRVLSVKKDGIRAKKEGSRGVVKEIDLIKAVIERIDFGVDLEFEYVGFEGVVEVESINLLYPPGVKSS